MTTRIALVPRDALFFKDGRGWSGSGARGRSYDWPLTTTLRGAARAAYGRKHEDTALGRAMTGAEWEQHTNEVSLGWTFPLRRAHAERMWKAAHRMWPVPVDALHLADEGTVVRLDPKPHAGSTLGVDDGELADAREALWTPSVDEKSKPVAAPRWWTDEHFIAWLRGAPVKRVASERDRRALELPERHEVHVSIDPDRFSARDGALYALTLHETLGEGGHRWAIALEADAPDPAAFDARFVLGGNGRTASVDALDAALFAAPGDLLGAFEEAPSRHLRLVVTTPTVFDGGWVPDGFAAHRGELRGALPAIDAEVILRAAFVPRPLHGSGWNMVAGQPRPTRRMVPPGAVYFFERVDGRNFSRADAEALWGARWGAHRDDGLGRVVPGVWLPQMTDTTKGTP